MKVIFGNETSAKLSSSAVSYTHLKEGVSFVYISHKMPELFEICENFYVLRDGKMVSQGKFSHIDENDLTEMMIGRYLIEEDFSKYTNKSREELGLSVKNLSGRHFFNINFDVHKGEILAITGLQGSGCLLYTSRCV